MKLTFATIKYLFLYIPWLEIISIRIDGTGVKSRLFENSVRCFKVHTVLKFV